MQIGSLRFDRMEFAGSLGDLGTLLPLAIGMVMINGLDAQGLFFAVGLFYIVGGAYFRVPIAVQPMKVVSATAIATGVSALDIQAASLVLGVIFLTLGATNLISPLARVVPRSVIRGVQVSTGALLAAKGVSFIAGISSFQKLQGLAEPFLIAQHLGPVPVGIAVGIALGVLTLFLLDSRKLPAGLVVVVGGLVLGLLCGAAAKGEFTPGFSLPGLFPLGFPKWASFVAVTASIVLPQVPMTIGNAIIANADLSADYFKQDSRRVTSRALCISIGLANILVVPFGGMPMCHGAGGLAAHYRFGARTSGSNYIIGALFLVLAVVLGAHVLDAVRLLPMGALGVLLVFAGLQLCLTVMDMDRRGMFVVFFMLAMTLSMNLAWAFAIGLGLAYVLKSERFRV